MESRSKKFNLLIYQTGKILIYTLAAATFKNEYQEFYQLTILLQKIWNDAYKFVAGL